MKNIIFFLAFISIISTGIAQSSNELHNMINNCLNDCLTDTRASSVALEGYPFRFRASDSVKNNLKNRQLKVVSITSPKFRKYLKKEQYVLLFDGIFLDSNKLIIQFSERSVQYKTKEKYLNIAISDWYKYIYEYSYEEKRWILIEKVFDGI